MRGCSESSLLIVVIGLVFTVPFVYVAFEGAREVRIAVHFLAEAQRNGIPVPDWVPQLPAIGRTVEEWWRDNLSDPNAAQELLGRFNARAVAGSARHYGAEVVHRLIIFGFTLLTLFFLFRDGTFFSTSCTTPRAVKPENFACGSIAKRCAITGSASSIM